MRPMLRRAFPAACALVLASWPIGALAQARVVVQPKDQIVLRGDVVVPRGQAVGEVVSSPVPRPWRGWFAAMSWCWMVPSRSADR